MSQYISFIKEDAGIVKRGRPFIKMHGLRNDFIIVDGRREPYRPSAEEIIRICNRHEGVGGDELLIVNPPELLLESDNAYAFVRIFNPDGREVEACGNATRCVGWLFLQESQDEEVVVDTLGGRLACRGAGEKQVAVEMGKLRTAWQDIPLAHEMDTLHLGIGAGPLQDPVGMNIGNPHAVFLWTIWIPSLWKFMDPSCRFIRSFRKKPTSVLRSLLISKPSGSQCGSVREH